MESTSIPADGSQPVPRCRTQGGAGRFVSRMPSASVAGLESLRTSSTVMRCSLAFEPLEACAPVARRAALDILRSWGIALDRDVAHSLQVVVSELFGNAVQHAGRQSPRITVVLERYPDGGYAIGVRDHGPAVPTIKPATPEDTQGRGLAIVTALTDELGGHLATLSGGDGTKTVWAAVPGAVTGAAAPERLAWGQAVACERATGLRARRGCCPLLWG